MELGPIQKKWLEALRSGQYQQGRGALNLNGKFCCLGVLCESLGLQKKPVDDSEPQEFCYRLNAGDFWSSGVLPSYSIVDFVGLVSNTGNARQYEGDSPLLAALTRCNDSLGMTFEQIADLIEANPDKYLRSPGN